MSLAGAAHAGDRPSAALVPELVLGAGYDDNLFLDAFPAGPMDTKPRKDAIFDVEPRLGARLGVHRHTLALSLDDLERFTISSGHIRDLDVRLGYRTPQLGLLELTAALDYKHWDATFYPGDRSELVSASVAGQLALGTRMEAVAQLRGAGRLYPSRGQVDREVEPAIRLRVRMHPRVLGDVGYAFLELASTEPRVELARHSVDLSLSAHPLDWLTLRAQYVFSAQHLPAGVLDAAGATFARNDRRHQLHAIAIFHPTSFLDVFAEYSLFRSGSDQAPGNFVRNQVIVGIAAYGAYSRPLVPSLAPVIVGENVTFRYRGRAAHVSVVGDWNDWNVEAAPLRGEPGDNWSGSFVVPPGRHTYGVHVDGRIEAPPDADTYISDGFGGRSGVFTVR